MVSIIVCSVQLHLMQLPIGYVIILFRVCAFSCSHVEDYMSENVSHVISLEDWDDHFDQVRVQPLQFWVLLETLYDVSFSGSIREQQTCVCETSVDFCVPPKADLCPLSTVHYCSKVDLCLYI